MTINTAEKNLHNLEKKEAEAYDFGFDGGGKSYIYYFDDKPVLALVPKMNSDIILAIVAISPKFKLENGLHPNATVSDLLKKYPNSKVYQNLMMEWEMMYDYERDFTFVFVTEGQKEIGVYQELIDESIPEKTDIKVDWITIL